MTLSQLLRALRARYRIIVLATLLTVAVALVVSLLMPKQYIATSAVVVDTKYADPIAGSILPGLTQPSYMATQIDVISSDAVSERVVRMLKLDTREGIREAWQEATDGKGTLASWLAGGLRGKLDARPSKDSNVIAISFKSPDGKFAAAVANAYAQAYIDTTVALRTEPARRYSAYFEEQAQAARDRLERAQAALSAYQRDNGIIVATDERYDIENARLAELSTQLSAIQGERADTQSRQSQSKSSGGTMQEVLQNPLIQTLKAETARAESTLQQMSGNLGPNNPQFQRQQAQVDSLRHRLATETAQLTTGIATNNRVVAQREADTKAALESQKTRVLKFKQDRDAASVLQRDVDAAQRAFDAVSQRVTQSTLESQTNQTNIAILNPAIEPSRASSPRIPLNLGIAVFAGLILGIGMALLLEQTDRRIRSTDDLGLALGHPVLGVLPAARAIRARLTDEGGYPRLGGPRPALR